MSKSVTSRISQEEIFARHPVLGLDTWADALGGRQKRQQARARARYYCQSGRLLFLARGLYSVVPPGVDSKRLLPDPYLVAAALRKDAILSHHTALDLLGVAHSIFHRFPYLTSQPRRVLRFRGMEWRSVAHPSELVKRRKIEFGVDTIDRQGVTLRVTGPERTVVDGFLGLRWVGGLEEHVESASGFRDLDLGLVTSYLKMLDHNVLYAAVGWFLEKYPEVGEGSEAVLGQLEKHIPKQPLYLGPRQRGGKLERRWNLVVPAHLSSDSGFEGAGRGVVT